ncbi:uroporphyrinogen-III C-methyltransferase [Elusimicrobiota bacterium]
MVKLKKGIIYLIGAGPGDPELITIKGNRLLNTCDAVVYDNLVANELIVALPHTAQKYYVGKKAGHHCFSQGEINRLLVKLAKRGKKIARLKGGDPFIFGRGSEEARYLKKHKIRFEIVSGVTSGVAALAYNGIPCTDRTKSSFVVFATGHKASEKRKSAVPWSWLARAKQGTTVIYMGIGELEGIVEKLLDGGMPKNMPSAIIERGTLPSQRMVTSDLCDLPKEARKARIKPPAIIVAGETIDLRKDLKWYEKKPLSGVRVMITRLANQAQEMHDALREMGAEVLAYPTIAVDPVCDKQAWKKFNSAIPNFFPSPPEGEGRVRGIKFSPWLVFTSENGVKHFFSQFIERFKDIRKLSGFKIACVGTGTAKALRSLNLHADYIPPKANVKTLADSMLKKFKLSGAQVVRIRGNIASRTFESKLGSAGINVLPITVYKTYHPKWPEGLKGKLFDHPPHAIIFTSGSAVDGFFYNLKKDEAKQLTSKALIASIGPMTSKVLKEKGLKVKVEAKGQTISALVKAIARRF